MYFVRRAIRNRFPQQKGGGQVAPDSLFGKVLERLAENESYRTFLEVGTWNGEGSTRSIATGIQHRNTPAEFWSYEANLEMFGKASQYWSSRPQWLHLVYGSLHGTVMSRDQVVSHPNYPLVKEHYTLWYDDEAKCCTQSPIVLPPESVDVILLDGGEFSTAGDWEVLKKCNPKVVALDDTSVIKTSDIRKELLESSEWETVEDHPKDRNGWAIFKRA